MVPLPDVKDFLSASDKLYSLESQQRFVSEVVKSKIVLKHPISLVYKKGFLKAYINLIEAKKEVHYSLTQ
jgi:hypothetical protein